MGDSRGWRACAAALFLAFVPGGCSEAPKPPAASQPSLPPEAAALWMEFSGERAMEHVKKQVELGPRPSGTGTLEKARMHIIETLRAAGWDAERQEFEATPVPGRAPLRFVNVIGRFPDGKDGTAAPRTTQRAIIGSHYDTKRMTGINFVGANDAGSSTGALLELARVLAKVPALAEQVELVFFDGEEAVESFSPDAVNGPDGLVGSRHYAGQLRASGRARQFQFAIVWDMIGDKHFALTLPSDSPPHLVQALNKAAAALNLSRHVTSFNQPILDDHVPIQAIARIPAIDFIDFDYPPWHTEGDTLDKLSPESLRITGQLTLSLLAVELGK